MNYERRRIRRRTALRTAVSVAVTVAAAGCSQLLELNQLQDKEPDAATAGDGGLPSVDATSATVADGAAEGASAPCPNGCSTMESGTTSDDGPTSPTSPDAGPASVKTLAAGGDHTCALFTDGTVKCWGDNSYGELGDGVATLDSGIDGAIVVNARPVVVAGLSKNVTGIAVGDYHTCARIADGTARCWGSNSTGALGDGTTKDSPFPVQVGQLSGVVALAAGGYGPLSTDGDFTCAVMSGGTVQCWGYDEYYELGNSAAQKQTTPVPVQSIGTATGVATGGSTACALLANTTADCWGRDDFGEVGNDASPTSVAPAAMSGLTGVTQLAVGALHVCALLSGGTVACAGDNQQGELGASTTKVCGATPCSTVPVLVSGDAGASAIAAGAFFNCALVTGGNVECWGDGLDGQLGDGRGVPSQTPVLVTEQSGAKLSGATAIAAGTNHACALLANGAVVCWGSNKFGQLGASTSSCAGGATQCLWPVTVQW
jgi:alpha-tubulin suppressor-like RCC1 family protein